MLRSEFVFSPLCASLASAGLWLGQRKLRCNACQTFDGVEAEYVKYLEESTEDQTKALARGIVASNQPFIWTIKDPVGGHVNSCDFLPEGFIEAMRDRGMNSTLESISAGVPIVVWPLMLDQFANAKLVIEQFMRLGLQICEGFDAIPSSNIVEDTLKVAMTMEIGKDMRQRALKN
ncbi:hypothetical protein SUGI_0724300 [Cryptomeria japonica]|nr:hypothetical protein SUGI_0724300 [Cryptomeria japonica]